AQLLYDLARYVAAPVGGGRDVDQYSELLEFHRRLALRDHDDRDLAAGDELRLLAAGADEPWLAQHPDGSVVEPRARREVRRRGCAHAHARRSLRLPGVEAGDGVDDGDAGRRSLSSGHQR